jgi:hypothetical protein
VNSPRPDLKLDWCSHSAARYACLHWHYSKRTPVFKRVNIGIWEAQQFIGAIIFSQGATPEIGNPFGLNRQEICELTRVALTDHVWPVSRMISVSIAMLRRQSPGLKAVISFADKKQQHYGGIYQASGWCYLGLSRTGYIVVNGVTVHPKTLHSRYGKGGQSIPWLRARVDPRASRTSELVKYKYALGLTDELKRRFHSLARPYPKRAGSIASDASANHAEQGGATPTSALIHGCTI